jgi:hypothetical protein
MTKNKFINDSGSTGSTGSQILKFIVLVGLILGVCAFVMVLTRKCKCKDNFKSSKPLCSADDKRCLQKCQAEQPSSANNCAGNCGLGGKACADDPSSAECRSGICWRGWTDKEWEECVAVCEKGTGTER